MYTLTNGNVNKYTESPVKRDKLIAMGYQLNGVADAPLPREKTIGEMTKSEFLEMLNEAFCAEFSDDDKALISAPEAEPITEKTKAELLAECEQRGIGTKSAMTKAELTALLAE